MKMRVEDPVLISARREALLVFVIWLVASCCSIGVCFRLGYGRDAATLTYVLGFPDWVFWGIVVPWATCTGLSFALAYFVIADDELGDERAEEQLGTGGAEAEHV